jgi:hypothetical protein
MRKTRDQHLFSPGPKRILALDGGGVHGAMSLAMLRHVERLLAARSPDAAAFRLCDYFDLIGGTSTGSLIAAGLAVGMSVDELLELYEALAGEVFRKPFLSFGLIGAKFPVEPLERIVRRTLGDTTLGDARLRTGLAILTKRLDTRSSWVLHNNPKSRYFDAPDDDAHAFPNRDISLADAILASVAAPTYFDPRFLQVTQRETGAFVDGGVSPHNNPSLMLLMMATTGRFGYRWPSGVDNLMLVSMGAGLTRRPRTADSIRSTVSAMLAKDALVSLIDDCNLQAQALLQWMGRSPTARTINAEIGDLTEDRIPGGDLLWYLRYDSQLTSAWLSEHCGLTLDDDELVRMEQFDLPENVARLIEIGDLAGARQVRSDHFLPQFDPPTA